jgi:NADPH:quinone reductase
MRAIGVHAYGGPEALETIDLPEVHAGPGEVRLRVHAATVNPTDTLARNGSRAEAQREFGFPIVPGMDAAGVVDEVGPGVTTGIRVGDRAMAVVVPKGAHGAYRQNLVVPAASVARAPANASHAEASTLPMNGLTARLSLDLLGLEPGQTLAVTGAAGCYGGYVVQLAKVAGLTVIADASEAEAIRRHVPEGVDGLADGSVQNDLVIGAVRDGGAFTSIRGFSARPQRAIAFTTTWVVEYSQEHQKLDELRQLVEDGAVTLRVAATFPVDRASEAHARLEAGGTRGRCVIEFD